MSEGQTPASSHGVTRETITVATNRVMTRQMTAARSLAVAQENLKHEYRKIDSREDGQRHPIDIIFLIVRNSEVAAYIEDVEFDPWYDDVRGHYDHYIVTGVPEASDSRHDSRDASSRLKTFKSKFDEIKPTMETQLRVLGISGQQRDRWTRAVEVGHSTACFATLLALLPKLSFLRLAGHGRVYREWLNVCFRQARSSTHPVLTRLSSVEVKHWDTENEEDPVVLQEMLLIPSLRDVETFMLGSCYATWSPSADIMSALSSVERVQMDHCTCSMVSFLKIFTPLKKLKALDFFNYDGPNWSYCGYENKAAFLADFKSKIVPLLIGRGLAWKIGIFGAESRGPCADHVVAGIEGFRIRCKDLIHDLDEVDDEEFKARATNELSDDEFEDDDGNVYQLSELLAFTVGYPGAETSAVDQS